MQPAFESNVSKHRKQQDLGLYVDLSECSGMDSTFMESLAMIALKVKQLGITADIINAGENNIKLLTGLGLQKLFQLLGGGSRQKFQLGREEVGGLKD